LAHIRTLKELHTLWLWNPDITDSGLALCEGWNSLRELALGYAQITDAGIAHLKKAPNLDTLFLHCCPITDTGLLALQAMPRLRTLRLEHWDWKVTAAGVRKLQQARPKLRIIIGANSQLR
jgi:hypothetical protein